MSGISGLLNTGNNALRSSQTAINVTGNNVANVNTYGYSRQSVIFTQGPTLEGNPGQMGTGAYASQIYRNFDRFLENSYLDQNSQANMWNEQAAILSSVEGLFNEANTNGVHNQMSVFFNSWADLGTDPDSLPTREAVLSQADNLTKLIRDNMASLGRTKDEMDFYIDQQVEVVNDLLVQIADINKQIVKHHNPPHNTANSLLDERDRLVRDLGTLVDIRVQDNGPRDFNVYLKEGMPLIDGDSAYALDTHAPYYENNTKNFTGELIVEGEDHNEYTFEFISATDFKVSLDGGKTWATDSNGNSSFTVPPVGEKLKVGELKISFTGGGYVEGEVPKFDLDDKFHIVPKRSIKWHEPTRGPVDASKIINNESIGGKLGAFINSRDAAISVYEDQLDALAKSLIWEVNRQHSQGTGLKPFTKNIGTTIVDDYNLALGSPWQNIVYSDKLSSGNLNMYFFDETTGEPIPGSAGDLNFNPTLGGPKQDFDPAIHTLNDVVDAINRSYVDAAGAPLIKASIINGQIQLEAAPGVAYKMGSDTTGLWAALGVNTFFAGDSASNITVNPHLEANHVNAQSIDGAGAGEEGDKSIATMISKLATEKVNVSTAWQTNSESLLSFYTGTVGMVGADARNANFNAKYYGTLAAEAENQSLATSGVNLDEEMLLLIKFQHSYTAAAKLITTADEMFQTILSLKP